MSEWSATIQQWLIDPGYCYAAGLASAETGEAYAAAGTTDDPMSCIYCADHEEKIPNEAGGEDEVVINEPLTILSAATEFSAPNGVWIGKEKYKIVRPEPEFEYNDETFCCVFCAKSKGGAYLVKTSGGSIVIALYDEEKEQSSGQAKTGALAFAQYLNQNGY